jgi:hypothetical protein
MLIIVFNVIIIPRALLMLINHIHINIVAYSEKRFNLAYNYRSLSLKRFQYGNAITCVILF